LFVELIIGCYSQEGPAYNHLGYTQDRLVNSERHRNALYAGPSCVLWLSCRGYTGH